MGKQTKRGDKVVDSDNWRTGPDLVDPIVEFWPEGADLDVACGANDPILPARVRYSIDNGHDGLAMPWSGLVDHDIRDDVRRGLELGGVTYPPIDIPELESPLLVWMNGPWSGLAPWVARAHAEAKHGYCEVLSVSHVATGTSWWQRHVWRASAICWLYKRPAFLGDDGKPTNQNRYDCAVYYWGADVWRFREVFRRIGRVEVLVYGTGILDVIEAMRIVQNRQEPTGVTG